MDGEQTAPGGSLTTVLMWLAGLAVSLVALVKSMASEGSKSAQATNGELFKLVNTLQGTVATLVEQGRQTSQTQLDQEYKIGRLTSDVEHFRRDNEKLNERVLAAEAQVAKEIADHLLTKAALRECQTSLGAMTDERDDLAEKLDELKLTLDEKAKVERENAAGVSRPRGGESASQ